MEDDPFKLLRDKIYNPSIVYEENREDIERYENAGRIGRWLVKRRNPIAADMYDYIQAQRSVSEAIAFAHNDPDNERLLHSAA